jgi:uncharacterized GH25 family protein
MKVSHKVLGVASATAFLVAAVARIGGAHETWLQPATFNVGRPATQVVRMTSGLGYPAGATPIEASAVTRSGVFLSGVALGLTPSGRTDHELALNWTPPKAGVAAIYVELAAVRVDRPDSLIGAYFDEIGAPPELRNSWADTPSPKRWRESYVKHAKTYVRVGDSRAKFAWRAKTGMGLEIVPESDPTLVAVGDTFRVRVLRNGLPVARFRIASRRSSGDKPNFITTDKLGRAQIVYTTAMPTLMSGTSVRRVHEKNLEWRSDFTSMSFNVLPRR